MGTRLRFSAFDPTSKLGWLNADLHGLFFTLCLMTAATLALTGIMYGTTGIFLLAPFALAVNFLKESLGADWAIAITIAAAIIPSFVLVFVFRRNLAVIGPRRQFRYICSWL